MTRLHTISQNDPKWAGLKRYDKDAVEALQALDEAIQELLKIRSGANEKSATSNRKLKQCQSKAWEACARFSYAIGALIKDGSPIVREDEQEGEQEQYSVEDYGCWDCSVCMVIERFNGRLYAYESNEGLKPTPVNLLAVLRSWQIISYIGYMDDIPLDPVATITNGEICMVMHEDYGRGGIRPEDSSLLRYALECGDNLALTACVEGHPFFGKKDCCHWVFIDPRECDGINRIIMRDPDCRPESTGPKRMNYSKIYELCAYASRKEGWRFPPCR